MLHPPMLGLAAALRSQAVQRKEKLFSTYLDVVRLSLQEGEGVVSNHLKVEFLRLLFHIGAMICFTHCRDQELCVEDNGIHA